MRLEWFKIQNAPPPPLGVGRLTAPPDPPAAYLGPFVASITPSLRGLVLGTWCRTTQQKC